MSSAGTLCHMIAPSTTPMNRSPTSPTTIPTPNRPIAAAEPSPLSDRDVCWSSLTFSRNLALGNSEICSSATGPVDAFSDAEDRLAEVEDRLAYVKPIIPGLRSANRNSVILDTENVRLSEGGVDTVVEFSVDINDDIVVDGFSEDDGDDGQDVRFSVADNVDHQAVKFSAGCGDDQNVRFSIGNDVDQEVRFSVGVADDRFSVCRFSLDGGKDVFVPWSIVGRVEAPVMVVTADRVSHRCVTFTVTVAWVAVIITSKHDVRQLMYCKSGDGRTILGMSYTKL